MRTNRTIRNCAVRMKVVCPKIWDDLQATSRPGVRHCAECDREVFFCGTDTETLEHVRAGRCIAREEPHGSELPSTVVGMGEVVPVRTEEQERALRLSHREEGITTLINGRLQGETRDCPGCGYPVPSFRKTCYVCGFEIGRV